MNESQNPHKIIEKVNKGTLNKSDAAEILISLIEASDDTKILTESIIGLDYLALKTENIFKILENHLISDKNPFVRNAATRAIIHHFLKEGVNSLEWVITHDNSPLVLKTIFEFLTNFKEKSLTFLKRELNEWMEKFAREIGVTPQEAKFFLDVEALFANDNENFEINTFVYKYFKDLTDFKTNQPWLVLKNGHVEILNFNYYYWKYLKENRDHIESIVNVKRLDLFLRSIHKLNPIYYNSIQIPESIGLLKYLRVLNLSRNKLKTIPDSISSLKSIESLNLSHNHITEISESLCSLNSLRRLNLSHNHIHDIPPYIKHLNQLCELIIHRNKIKSFPDSLKIYFDSLETFRI